MRTLKDKRVAIAAKQADLLQQHFAPRSQAPNFRGERDVPSDEGSGLTARF
jgi:hypothetical protein